MLFKLFAFGYPMPMAKLCKNHLGLFIEKDQQHVGATFRYTVEPVSVGSCQECNPKKQIHKLPDGTNLFTTDL